MQVYGYSREGAIHANIEGVEMFVPNDPRNRHRQMIAEWEDAGNQIPPYEEAATSLPPLSPRQLRLMMLQIGITEQAVVDQIAAIADPQERAAAEIEWAWATRYDREHPLVVSLADALEFAPEQLDALWMYAADL